MESPKQQTLREQLASACSRAEDGGYDDALRIVRGELRQFEGSIYLLALEHQLEQLKEYSTDDDALEMQRLDILDSLPGLAEKAAESPELTYKNLSVREAPHPDELEAARRWLLTQYLQHAYQFMVQTEYERALVEVQRMYILEPENALAKALESRLRSYLTPPPRQV
jgi:hypothetical protein